MSYFVFFYRLFICKRQWINTSVEEERANESAIIYL